MNNVIMVGFTGVDNRTFIRTDTNFLTPGVGDYNIAQAEVKAKTP